ncbi:hypothetical protein HPP92_009504 [Vanilla planifolia]|uniref:Pentatricopeptide repeat-containing protein n=1 Tax=Vanilla planifolia TaxID=51239 RepID=A0A835V6D5_VANPL|nr:hypothetical protein HPP92_009504 [Vanilla planifolia]
MVSRSSSFLPFVTASTLSSEILPSQSTAVLTDAELGELRTLLPSLCDAGRPLDAVRLLDSALLAAPPLSSLPIPELTDRLSSLPDMSFSIRLLDALRNHPRRPSPLPFCAILLSSYFRRRRLREAAKVFAWLCQGDSPCRPDMEIYGAAIQGFCERGRPFEAMRVAREMATDGMIPPEELRVLLCQGLLREARVEEALDLDSAIRRAVDGDDGIHGLTQLLDRMIRDWQE